MAKKQFCTHYPVAVDAVYSGRLDVAGCVVKDERRNEFQAILVEDVGGVLPQATVVWTGTQAECKTKIRQRLA